MFICIAVSFEAELSGLQYILGIICLGELFREFLFSIVGISSPHKKSAKKYRLTVPLSVLGEEE
jgi:hypothetical protein